MNPGKTSHNQLNPRQEKFAQLIADGTPAVTAYKQAGYSAKRNGTERNAHRLKTQNDAVRRRIDELKATNERNSQFKQDDMIAWLSSALTTPIGKIDETHPLAQEMVRDMVEMKPNRGKKGEIILKSRIKSVSKMACAQLLCDVMAWKAPTEIIHETGAERLAEAEKRAASGYPPSTVQDSERVPGA